MMESSKPLHDGVVLIFGSEQTRRAEEEEREFGRVPPAGLEGQRALVQTHHQPW